MKRLVYVVGALTALWLFGAFAAWDFGWLADVGDWHFADRIMLASLVIGLVVLAWIHGEER